ncbi:amino acid ABC transporter permease [Crocosphaera watsonii WH 8501]|uniref:Amino acid ABC transporter, permease protein, 3-TM region, His/Glu/Gln/Arg/opine n=1 Tax=Crocosphaera watsonii WH 8501 TaxID=165597 RepID=Q4C4B5_CROWT|nr:ABC transporter permease subunit [Crocosphaera watsonii]EAM50999.1 Amino acid ABC transporter, permease protein, 3-TM region, His/Glu/Gln/Arg/opine [Crocosphaera watsonii WH 8501]
MSNINQEKIPFWRDSRIIKVVIQVLVIGVILLLLVFFGNNLVNNFRQLGLTFGFGFIFDPELNSRFNIGDSPIPYQPTDPYYRAILVGLLNSLRVMITGIILAFILGVIIGLGRLSDNWLVQKIATVYVEIIRNTPLLLQLFFLYFAVFLKFPKIDAPLIIFNSVFLSNQGVYVPFPLANLQTFLAILTLFFGGVIAFLIWRKQTQTIIQQGTTGNFYNLALIVIIIVSILTIILGFDWEFPSYDSQIKRIQDGLNISPEFATLLAGLTIYTAGFIAEVVRSGIQSVSKGQWEAAKALGLNSGLAMRLVIFPQALRVMIPPLTSEFLNLAKNSSLAVAIGYNDIYAVSNTISNQTGKSIEMLLVVMATYLIFNLIISTVMNLLNRSVQLKEK